MATWASTMSVMPGLSPRPQHHICDKKDHTEEVNSTSNSLFVHIRNCEDTKVKLTGKVGKVTIETSNQIMLTISDRIVSGTLELIKCKNVVINLIGSAEVPTVQVDDSNAVSIEIERKSQIECIYFIRCHSLKLLLNRQNSNDGNDDAMLQYDIPTSDDRAQIHQIAHWSTALDDADFITETVVREGIYPTTSEEKHAAVVRQEEALKRMDGMSGLSIHKQTDDSHAIDEEVAAATTATKPRENYGRNTDDEKKEYFDDPETLSKKLDRLVELMKESHHTIFFTGAGISTSAGIPDFRSGLKTVLPTGPGAWELRDNGKVRSKKHRIVPVLQAIPTPTHMAIVKLLQDNCIGVNYVVSQNTDGLHLRSGVRPNALSELHGNTYMEICKKCKNKYLRDFRTRNAKKVHNHRTGRFCLDHRCRGDLLDSIINFGEDLPEKPLNKAYTNARKANLCICLGSSLTVSPANEIPEIVADRKQHLVIVNLQKTPLHSKCDLAIHALCDDVMIGVIQRLNMTVDKWYLRRRVLVNGEVQGRDLTIKLSGLDQFSDCPYSLFTKVIFKHKSSGSSGKPEEIIITKEPILTCIKPYRLNDKISCQLFFHGHYNEEPLDLSLNLKHGQKKKWEYNVCVCYDLETREWNVESEGERKIKDKSTEGFK